MTRNSDGKGDADKGRAGGAGDPTPAEKKTGSSSGTVLGKSLT